MNIFLNRKVFSDDLSFLANQTGKNLENKFQENIVPQTNTPLNKTYIDPDFEK